MVCAQFSEWRSRPDPLFPQEALKAKLGSISQEAQSKLEEETAKKEAKADAKADAARKKKLVCFCGHDRPPFI